MTQTEIESLYATWSRWGFPPLEGEEPAHFAQRIFSEHYPGKMADHIFNLIAVCHDLPAETLNPLGHGTLWRADDSWLPETPLEECKRSFLDALRRIRPQFFSVV